MARLDRLTPCSRDVMAVQDRRRAGRPVQPAQPCEVVSVLPARATRLGLPAEKSPDPCGQLETRHPAIEPLWLAGLPGR
jgi:hypothetical protein